MISVVTGAMTGAFAVWLGHEKMIQLLGVVGNLAQTFLKARLKKKKPSQRL